MDGDTALTEISQDYFWAGVDLPRMALAFHAASVEIAGDEPRFSGSAEWNGPPRSTKRRETFADWLAALSNAPDIVTADVYAVDSGSSAHVRARVSDGSVNLSFRVPDGRVGAARAALDQLAASLVLQPELQGAIRDKRSSTEKTYRIPEPATVEWVTSVASATEARLVKPRFEGGFSTSGQSPRRETRSDRSAWLGALKTEWGALASADWWQTDRSRAISGRLDVEFGELRIRVEAPTQAEVDGVLDSLRTSLALEDAGPRPELGGEVRVYFTRDHLDQAWFARAAGLVKAYRSGSGTFDGRYRVLGQVSPGALPQSGIREFSEGDPTEWLQKVIAAWPSLVTSYAWTSGPRTRIRFSCDHAREMVELDVGARSEAEVEAIFIRFVATLGLNAAPPDAYGTVKTLAAYAIGGWTGERFVKAVRDAQANYVGDPYALVECLVVEGDQARTQRPFASLDAFLQRVGAPEPYNRAHLVLHGPHGAILGVHVTDDFTRLQLQSNLDAHDFERLRSKFQRLGLEPVKKESANTRVAPGFMDTTRGKLLAMALTAVVGALSWETLNAVIPRHEIVITQPSPFVGDTPDALPAGTEVRVEWIVQREQLKTKKTVAAGRARVRVLRAGGAEERNLPDQAPGVRLSLPPGQYTIEVYSEELGARATAKVSILPDSEPGVRLPVTSR